LTNSGNSSSRIAIVSRMIETAHDQPLPLPKIGAIPEWMWTINHAIAL
jgi:hypothetical protein